MPFRGVGLEKLHSDIQRRLQSMTTAKPAKKAYWTTTVSDVEEADVFIRGYSLGDLIGRIPYSAATYLVIRGKIPTPGEARVIDAMLCSIIDYSLYKAGTAAARYCVSGNPQMVPGMATAVLSVGEYTLAPEDTGRFVIDSYTKMKASGQDYDAFAAKFIGEVRASGQRVPGFGHPKFRFTDPRAQKLKQIAQKEGVWGEIGDWYEAVHRAFIAATGKPEIPINEVGIMAAIMAQMGFTPAEMTGIALISSLPGVVAHISEELQTKTRIRIIPDEIAEYPRLRRDLKADLAAAGW
jgi:citryl-CoA lyase